jgi:IS5 family transposase
MRRLRQMRNWVGRLYRDIARKSEGESVPGPSPSDGHKRVGRLMTQKPDDKNKLYALHAPEAECIGKDKARARYEFGIKCTLAVSCI